MTIQKPEPFVIGNRAFYTLASYGPVDVQVHVVRTTDEEVELAIQSLVREAGGTEKDLADPAWVAGKFDGIENEQRLREQTRAYLSSLSEETAEEQKADACLDALAERLCQSVPASQVSQVKDALFQDIAQRIATTGQPVEAVLAQMGMQPDQFDSMLQLAATKETEHEAALDAYASEKKIKVDETELPHLLQLSPADAQALIARAKAGGQMDQLLDAARRTKALEAVVAECHCTYVQESEEEAKKRIGEVMAAIRHQEELARRADGAAEKGSAGSDSSSGLKLV
ncbi:MAG: hypothetical protein LKI67_07515 [Olsenella sp.]|jgi:hypothetical protein|nr:hypothetical protein [Olsenella sp.]MCI1794069.1 hypothetical protein [Olsenella sp.]MCI1811690.1 hypothetical protein [Olsenella sp.]MCI1880493.1 hypothetical protein [Olsenella sp.]